MLGPERDVNAQCPLEVVCTANGDPGNGTCCSKVRDVWATAEGLISAPAEAMRVARKPSVLRASLADALFIVSLRGPPLGTGNDRRSHHWRRENARLTAYGVAFCQTNKQAPLFDSSLFDDSKASWPVSLRHRGRCRVCEVCERLNRSDDQTGRHGSVPLRLCEASLEPSKEQSRAKL
jgi:hypothetical protein